MPNGDRRNLIAETFGRLTVVSLHGRLPGGLIAWHAICSCGKHSVVRGASLRSGHVKSCGCLQKERTADALRRHGHAVGRRTAEYRAWYHMVGRCTNPSDHRWKWYGARGIAVCSRWQSSFQNFIDDMGPRPPGLTLERVNNDGDYEPGNCVWASRAAQAKNRRRPASHRTIERS